MDRTTAAGYTTVNGKRVYQDRDKPNGIVGTSLIALDRTAIQEEIMTVIEGAGLTGDAGDFTQLFKAINKILSGSEGGYFRKSGDTASWVTSDGWLVAGNSRGMSGGSGANGAIQAGDYVWSDGITAYGYGKMAVSLSVTDVNGKGGDYRSGGLLQFTAYDGTETNFYFRGDGYIYDTSGNKFLKAADLTNSLSGYLENYNPGIALALPGTSLCVNPADGLPYLAYAGNTKIAALAWNSDLAAERSARAQAISSEAETRAAADTALQNSINGKQPAGNYIIGLSGGKLLQDFVVAVDGSGVHDITLPQALSLPPTSIAISHGLTNGSNASVSVLGGWLATGFQIQTNGATSVNFIVSGTP